MEFEKDKMDIPRLPNLQTRNYIISFFFFLFDKKCRECVAS
jgi:hypothetical protein